MPRVRRQAGIIVPLMAGALVALLGMGALALDVGNLYREKALLQNALDAAALSAAKVLDATGDMAAARREAIDTFGANSQASGSHDLAAQFGNGAGVGVAFSSTLRPFVGGTSPPQYVRVSVSDMSVQDWFARVVGIERLRLRGSAVAGPSPTLAQVCNAAPMMVCAKGPPPFYGYKPGDEVELKQPARACGNKSLIGPGNFQLIRLGGPGGKAVRSAMAGGFESCMSRTGAVAINTEPGNKIGPVSQGINTRLGIYQGPLAGARDTYPPDAITTHPNYSYAQYRADLAAGHTTDIDGRPNRRVLAVPVGNCMGTANGQSTVPLAGFACFFLTDEVSHQGNEAAVYGEFIKSCQARGVPGPDPGSGYGPHVIQLYQDPGSIDS